YERDFNYPLYDAIENLPSQYVDSVRRAGGLPLMLPPGDDWRELLDTVDAVIVTGGADVNPAAYNGNVNHPAVQKLVPDRDAFDLALTAHVVKASTMPVLFICRGLQVLNVALGGTLHEHLPDILNKDIHRGSDGGWARHPITAVEGSLLADVMGTREAVTASGHHQAVRDIAPGMEITATAPDGVIEAITVTGRADLIAVQWHPEASAAEDPTQQRLFDWLVRRAAEGQR
ncbi:MAG: gamma-glutamyl-gamma-aminobutyrate hydrolase family protein, partial [Chloroflexota bacterium]